MTGAQTLHEIFNAVARSTPDKVAAIASSGQTRTYGELSERATAIATALHSHGLTYGDRVCLMLDNCMEWVETFFACLQAGYVAVPANPDWTPSELTYLLNHSEAKAVICRPESADHMERAEGFTPGEPILFVTGDGDLFGKPGQMPYRDLLTAGPAAAQELSAPDPTATAIIAYTSGTTSGTPKGVALSHRTILELGLAYGRVVNATDRDRCLFVTPLFHLNAVGAVLGAFSVGASIVFQQRFSSSSFWRLVDTYRPTYLFSMGTILNILMTLRPGPLERQHDMRAMYVLGVGAAAQATEDRYSVAVVDGYGMSEYPCGTYTPVGEPRKSGSAGKPFYPGHMRIQLDDGTEAAPGQTGEVLFLAEHSFDGYFADPELTSESFSGPWFHTGDLGYLDDDGYFFFVDRKKDIIRRGGENVSSLQVEEVLRSSPEVVDVAVVPVPDDVLGERIAAVVVAAPGAKPSLESLRAHAAKSLAQVKLPESLAMVDSLPRTPTGKIQKFAVRNALRAEAATVEQRTPAV
ncbi:class I adenylate-forming enzyme family protein [Rhodococcus sp. NPDC127530]|uniref:class I adenylate-forming enzyme family protein n=1 Tax=unclassified Rhodococcus (in: high G+C Gram-positive bacteria) TaxID=192944 RepID=UPI00363145E4